MIVYYKKNTVFDEYPWQHEVLYHFTRFSRSRKNFEKQVIMDLKSSIDFEERKRIIAKELSRDVSSITFKKLK